MADFITALTNGLSTTATSVLGAMGDILPVALPIMGAILAVGVGIKLFKRSTH